MRKGKRKEKINYQYPVHSNYSKQNIPFNTKITKNKFWAKFLENPEYAENAIQKNKKDHKVYYNKYFMPSKSFRQYGTYSYACISAYCISRKNLQCTCTHSEKCSSHHVTQVCNKAALFTMPPPPAESHYGQKKAPVKWFDPPRVNLGPNYKKEPQIKNRPGLARWQNMASWNQPSISGSLISYWSSKQGKLHMYLDSTDWRDIKPNHQTKMPQIYQISTKAVTDSGSNTS